MTQEFVIHLAKQSLLTALMIASPMLLFGLIVGLAVGIFQAVTQIHEMTLTFIPKILAVVAALLIFLPWMLSLLLNFSYNIFANLSTFVK